MPPGVPWGHASRHMMGLRNGLPGARRWRQVWSDPRLKTGPPQEALRLARGAATLQNRARGRRDRRPRTGTFDMTEPLLAIIGGSGLYDLPGLTDTRWVAVDTPWGAPSDEIFLGRLAAPTAPPGLPAAPRPRPPHPALRGELPRQHRRSKSLGATDVLSLSAVGSLRADLPPGTFVVVDQFIDRTFARDKSFFGTGMVAHVSMAHPVCPRLGDHVQAALAGQGVPHVRGGTYVVMEGPQFSTLAESQLYRGWNASVIGMTNMPEAKLAREAELCYCSVSMVTDFDCWHPATTR